MNIDQFQLDFPPHQEPEHSLPPPSSPSSDLDLIPSSSQLPISEISSSQLQAQGKPPRPTLAQKLQVLEWHHAYSTNQQRTVHHFTKKGDFSITRSSFNRWLKEESKLRESYGALTAESRTTCKTRSKGKNMEVDRCLELWYEQMLFNNEPISQQEIVQKWLQFYRLTHPGQTLEKETKSNGWLYHFKQGVRTRKAEIIKFVDNDMNLTREEEVMSARRRLEGVSPRDIFHIDEFMISGAIIPTGSSANVVMGICCNSDASEIRAPLLITNSKVDGCYNSRVGLTPQIFWDYIHKFDDSLKGRKVVLVLDRLYEHVVAQNLDNVTILWVSHLCLYHDLIRWFKLELKILLLKFIHIDSMNTSTVRVTGEAELVGMTRHIALDEGLIRNCWSRLFEHGASSFDLNEQELKFVKLLKLARDKNLLDTARLPTLEQIIFPYTEDVRNKLLSDQDIVARVKLMAMKPMIQGEQELNVQGRELDAQDWKEVDKFLHNDLPAFLSSSARFSKAREAYEVLMNEYVKESMDLWLDKQ